MLPFAEATDILQLEVISDRNLLGAARVIGTAQCSVADLGVNREITALPLRKDPGVTIRIRRVFSVPGRKKLYLVRHGESRWNRAQARRNVVGMLAFRDHPLNKTGAQQAIDLNKRWRFEANVESNRREEDEDLLNQTIDPRAAAAAMSAIAAQATMGQADLPACDSSKTRLDAQEQEQEEKEEKENESLEAGFFRAKAIFSSPLTRSLQTALLGLQHHPCALETGITLLTCAREVQNLLGKDSMGAVCGEESFLRAKQLLRDECGDLHSNWEAGVQGVDPYDAESEWWIATKESRASVVARTEDFVNTIRYRPEREIIVVGHSLFFKHLFQSLSWDLDMQHPDYAAKRSLLDQLRRFKIENCGVVGVELSFEHYWPHMRRHASLARLLPDEAVLGRRPLRRALVATASGAMVAGKVIPSDINRPASSDAPDRARAAVATPPMAVPGVKRTTFSAPDLEPAEIIMDDERTSTMQVEEGESKTEGEGEDVRYEEQMDAETELEESFGMDVEQDIVRSQILEAAAIVDVQLLFGSGLSNAPDESVDILAQTT
ncbi:Hypothetical Protein FCC1311_040692 [Hondaea fermentalgiana]|uniref:Uncharacterized protein n=1 Tax=Hondaea fermentalgiana TaxID=2315210 RepID=A0A2R5G9Z3_9STRA|nr:Hypothetical Protein FCC1311_040692 [Hondaea fermentalgiana]|eukprot:GBG27846.1 Hypothetical Protein FCC1311_040692 [Hondaea fermentalgiana]